MVNLSTLVYATPEDYDTFVGKPSSARPANLDKLLSMASRRVRGLTRTALYATDDTGMPTDAGVLAAFRDATCAHAEFLDETGDITGASSGMDDRSMSLGPLSIGGAATTGSGSGSTVTDSSPVAVELLTDAGLIGQPASAPPPYGRW